MVVMLGLLRRALVLVLVLLVVLLAVLLLLGPWPAACGTPLVWVWGEASLP